MCCHNLFNLIIKPLGGLPIDTKNKKKGGNVGVMADLFKGNNEFAMGITPEGTRSLRTKWKSGFYHLAKENNLPICFGYLDYRTKTAGIGGPLFISENKEMDMKQIMSFYKTKTPKNHCGFLQSISFSMVFGPFSFLGLKILNYLSLK